MSTAMAPSLILVLTGALLVGCGVYLLLARSMVRMLLGFVLLGNGVNLVFLAVSSPPGLPPLVGEVDPERMADPLPQAMMLTAIVISLGLVSFLLALAHRSWELSGTDRVTVDPEDLRIVMRADRHDMSGSDFTGDDDLTPDDIDDEDLDAEGDHYMQMAVRRYRERRRETRQARARAFRPREGRGSPVVVPRLGARRLKDDEEGRP